LVPEAVRRKLWVGLLWEGGAAGLPVRLALVPCVIQSEACSFV
jgi:hypothetical protein